MLLVARICTVFCLLLTSAMLVHRGFLCLVPLVLLTSLLLLSRQRVAWRIVQMVLGLAILGWLGVAWTVWQERLAAGRSARVAMIIYGAVIFLHVVTVALSSAGGLEAEEIKKSD